MLGDFGERSRGFNDSGAVAEDFFDGDFFGGFFVGFVVDDGQLVAIVEFTAIHDVTDVAVVVFEYDEFAWTPVREFGENTAAHDASIVENEKVARLEEVGKVGIVAVGDFASLAIKREQASSAADFWWTAGDTILWELIRIV